MSVNIFMTNLKKTGKKVPVVQLSLDVSLDWQHSDKQSKKHDGEILFPDILEEIPAEQRDELLREFIINLARIKIGVDNG